MKTNQEAIILAERAAVDRALAEREQIANLLQQRAQSPGVVEILHQELAGGADVGDERSLARQRVEAIDR